MRIQETDFQDSTSAHELAKKGDSPRDNHVEYISEIQELSTSDVMKEMFPYRYIRHAMDVAVAT